MWKKQIPHFVRNDKKICGLRLMRFYGTFLP